jgi:hypothetical protein
MVAGVARGHPRAPGWPSVPPFLALCGFSLSLSVSLHLSLFSVALSSDGGYWVATAQSEMGSTGGT